MNIVPRVSFCFPFSRKIGISNLQKINKNMRMDFAPKSIRRPGLGPRGPIGCLGAHNQGVIGGHQGITRSF